MRYFLSDESSPLVTKVQFQSVAPSCSLTRSRELTSQIKDGFFRQPRINRLEVEQTYIEDLCNRDLLRTHPCAGTDYRDAEDFLPRLHNIVPHCRNPKLLVLQYFR